MIAVVCQPLAMRPPNAPLLAASGSTCMSWGSNEEANATISDSVTSSGPCVSTSPGT